MKLTYEMLQAELSERLDCEVFGAKTSDILLEAPKLFDIPAADIDNAAAVDSMIGTGCAGVGHKAGADCAAVGHKADADDVASDHCYVTAGLPDPAFLKRADLLFIVCNPVPDEALAGLSCSLICFRSPQSVSHVMNALVDIFSTYRQWMDRLVRTLMESGSISALLRLSFPIFKNPLFLIDSRFNRIAEALPEDSNDASLPLRKVDEGWIIRGKDELINIADLDKPFFRHLADDFPRLFINLMEGEYLLGNLSIQASFSPLRAYDGYLLAQLASVVHIAMLRLDTSDNSWRNYIESILAEIIAGKTINEEEFIQAMSYFGYAPGNMFRCLAIRAPKPSGKEFIRNFMQLLGTQIPAMYVPITGEFVAIVMSLSRATSQGTEEISLLEDKMSALGFRVGVSESYENLLLSQHYFAQARYALVHGEVSQAEKSVTSFADYSLEYILEHAPGELKPHMLWNEGFRRLIAHDLKGRANYVETIRAYLANNLNAYRTAAELYISRNSLLSRLERILNLIGEDLNDPKVRFRYELSLLLYDKWREG